MYKYLQKITAVDSLLLLGGPEWPLLPAAQPQNGQQHAGGPQPCWHPCHSGQDWGQAQVFTFWTMESSPGIHFLNYGVKLRYSLSELWCRAQVFSFWTMVSSTGILFLIYGVKPKYSLSELHTVRESCPGILFLNYGV